MSGPPLLRVAPPLIGRARELAILRQRLDAARAGNGGLVLIGGEAGVGKTALAEAICREAEAHGALVLVGRCYDLTDTPPYGPWFDLVARAATTSGLPPAPALFSRWGGVSSTVSQAALFQQVQDFFAAVAAVRPLVLLLDDLHWADPASLDLLRYLARSVHALHLLVIVTYRADELTRQHPLHALLPLLEREAAPTRLAVRRLPPDAVRALIAARYDLAAGEAARLATYLDARAEGNALFVTQLLRALEEEAILVAGAHGWDLGDPHRLGMPLPLLEVIDARVARLPEAVQELLAVAAVIGQEVALALLAAVAGVAEDTLFAAVEEATTGHLVGTTHDGMRILFAHALIREAVYEAIPPIRRRLLHRQVAEALMRTPAADPDAVAYHLRRAGDARAVGWLVRAGERAQRAYARVSAIEHFERALELMYLASEADSAERCWLLTRLGFEAQSLDPRRALAHLDDAAGIAARLGDRVLAAAELTFRGIARSSADDHGQGAAEMGAGLAALDTLSRGEQERVAAATGVALDVVRGRYVLMLAMAGRYREAVAWGEGRTPTGGVAGNWPFGLALAYGGLGRVDEAFAAIERAYAIDHAAGEARQLTYTTLGFLTIVALPFRADTAGVLERFADRGEEAFIAANRLIPPRPPLLARLPLLVLRGEWEEVAGLIPSLRFANTSQQASALRVLGPFARVRGDRERAWQWVHDALPQGPASEPGSAIFSLAVIMQRVAAGLALDAGDLPTAREWLMAHDRWVAWSGGVLGQSEGEALWGQYYRLAGELSEASRHAARAIAHATDPRQPLALLAAHRLLGELATDAERYAEATSHLAASLALADACAAPYERALTLLAMAERDAAVGDRAAASALLDEARGISTRLGAGPALARADALSARLLGPPAAAPAYPAGLSAREVEVLRLVADGLTNREIADRLSLGERTVQTHVRSILTKTDTANRTAAAVFARDHGLA